MVVYFLPHAYIDVYLHPFTITDASVYTVVAQQANACMLRTTQTWSTQR